MIELQEPVGNQAMTSAFWMVIGSLVLSNVGLIINAVYSHLKKINKMSADVNAAHKEIRELKKQIKEKK
ncbi:MAG: hypothetical protein ACK41T_01105 [Pseudobdellovibrio sp.]